MLQAACRDHCNGRYDGYLITKANLFESVEIVESQDAVIRREKGFPIEMLLPPEVALVRSSRIPGRRACVRGARVVNFS